jgi:hypothetical protein
MKTTKIQDENYDGSRKWEVSLTDWAARKLTQSDRDGQIEQLEGQIVNVARAVGRLCELLVNTGRMSTSEFLQAVSPYEHPEPKFVQSEEQP